MVFIVAPILLLLIRVRQAHGLLRSRQHRLQEAPAAPVQPLAPTNTSVVQTVTLDPVPEESLNQNVTESAPAPDSCELDGAGFYGEPTGDVYEIEYLYQVTVSNGTTPATVKDDVTPALDVAVIAESLKFLFPVCRSGNGRKDRVLQQEVFNGVSTQQPDEFTENTNCKSASPQIFSFEVHHHVQIYSSCPPLPFLLYFFALTNSPLS